MMFARRCALLAVLLVGCGGKGDGLKLTRTEGRVLFQGQPAAGAVVTLVPDGVTLPVRPSGLAGPDGRFRLTSRVTGDGAPPGNYRVTVEWRPPPGPDQDDSQPAPDRLEGKYADPATTPLRATVPPPSGELLVELN